VTLGVRKEDPMSAIHRHSWLGGPPAEERRSVRGRVRRWGLATFFVSIAINAALGIYAVVAPDFGDTQSKILATSLFVTGTILVALACEPAWERGLLGPVPYAGALLGVTAFAMSIVGMWGEIDADAYGKTMGTLFVATAACTAASVLALARLAPRHEWVFVTALGLLGVGATMFGVLPWLGDDPPDTYVRGMGVVFIVLAAFTVTVPVLHWVDRAAAAPVESSAAVRYCPHCGAHTTGEVGLDLSCSACGALFTVVRLRPGQPPARASVHSPMASGPSRSTVDTVAGRR
jgi:hypothetical protein